MQFSKWLRHSSDKKMFILIKVTTIGALLGFLEEKYFKMKHKSRHVFFFHTKNFLKTGKRRRKMPHNSKPQLFSFHHHISTGLFFLLLFSLVVRVPGVTL